MIFVDIFLYLWELFKLWIEALFIVPIKNLDMLWIIIPLWLSWIFAEFFQEKDGTSFGNAISNSVIVLWGGIDSLRETFRLLSAGAIFGAYDIALHFLICGLLIFYGVIIIVFGAKVNKKVKFFGRIRNVTYAFAIFLPIIYHAMPLTFNHIFAAILFFPLFYYLIEYLDNITPDPKSIKMDSVSLSTTPVQPIVTNPQINTQSQISPQLPQPQIQSPDNTSTMSHYWSSDAFSDNVDTLRKEPNIKGKS